MKSILARTGLTLAVAFAILLATAPSGRSQTAAADGERTCHLDAAEKRKALRGVHRWTVRQLDRWCVREGRVISVRQTLEVETGTGWRLVSKSGTSRVKPDGTAISQGRVTVTRDRGERTCFPRIVGVLRPDGSAAYSVDSGC